MPIYIDVEEVVEEIESAFGIRFQAGELSGVESLAEVLALVSSRFPDESTGSCLTSIAFWKLRMVLSEYHGLPKGGIRPSTLLVDVLPRGYRRARAWRMLESESGLRMPGLVFGKLATWMLLVLPVFAAIGLGGYYKSFGIGAAAFLPLLFLTAVVLARFSGELPEHTQTVGDLARTAAALSYGQLVERYGATGARQREDAFYRVIGDVCQGSPDWLRRRNPGIGQL